MSASRPSAGNGNTSSAPRSLPERASLEQLRKQAKDLLRDARAGDAPALSRIAGLAADAPVNLANAQRAVAREYGFASWPKLVHHIEATGTDRFVLRPLIRPVEFTPGSMWKLPGQEMRVPADDAFAMYVAARDGDFATVKQLTARNQVLATIEYNYTPPIHFAVREGHREIVEFLLAQGADPAYRSYPFQESLMSFAEDRGHLDVVDALRGQLSRRFPVASGTEAIIAAADAGDVGGVERELARDPSLLRAANETGDTPLHRAAKHGHLRVVRALLDAGAPPDMVRGDGYRPIHCALMPNWFYQIRPGDREQIVELLLPRAHYTIFIAAMRGDMQYVRDALARDRSLANFEDTCHHRVLSAAVRRRDVAMTRLLLEHGADPNLPEEGSMRGLSLYIAVTDREREIVRMLLAHGADPNAEVESSGTPMLPAEKDAELTQLLIQHGGQRKERPAHDFVQTLLNDGKLDEAEALLRANPNWLQDKEAGWGDGMLAGPANAGRNDIIAMLMRLGATVPRVSKWAPYYYFKHEATAVFLLEHGMDPDHMNWHRFTLLHHMAAEGSLAKSKLLITHGANLDAIDDEYRSTPLGVAARRGQEALVKLLLENGADPTAAGADWAVPLAWAERKGHTAIAELLRNHRPVTPA